MAATVDRATPAPPKVFGRTRTKVVIAAVSAAALSAGALLKPDASPAALTPPKEHSAPLLEEQSQRRAPLQAFAELQEIGTAVVQHTVAIPAVVAPARTPVLDFPSPPRPLGPAGFGVIVSPAGMVLTKASALEGRETLQLQLADGTFVEARLTAFEPETGLAVLSTSAPQPVAAPPIAQTRVQAGSLAAAAARWDSIDVVAPVFITEVRDNSYRFTAAGSSLPAGTPIFMLDRQLFAIAAGPEGPGWAYPVHEAVARLGAAVSAGRGLPASLGITLQPRDALADAFGDRGVIVSDVLAGGAADAAGLQPGDVLLAIDGADVESPSAAQRAIGELQPGATVRLRVTAADGAERDLALTTGSAFGADRLIRRDADAAAAAPDAGGVLSEPQLQAAGLPPTARLLSVNGRPAVSRAQVQRELRTRPARLYVQHDGRRYFAVLPGAQ